MKQCPKCNNRYTDNDLTFCLADGTALTDVSDPSFSPSAPTITIPAPHAGGTPNNQKGTNVVLVIATIFLSVIVVVGATFFLSSYFWLNSDDAKVNNSESAASSGSNSKDNEPASEAPPKDRAIADSPQDLGVPENIGTPPKNSKIFGLKRYGGNIGGGPAIFDLTWRQDSSILGNFYYRDAPASIYDITGSNYAQGKAALEVRLQQEYVGKMNLYKTLEGRILCWQGNFTKAGGSVSAVRFCRYR